MNTLRSLPFIALAVLSAGCRNVPTLTVGDASVAVTTVSLIGDPGIVHCRFRDGTAEFDIGLGVPSHLKLSRNVGRVEILKSRPEDELVIELSEAGEPVQRFAAGPGSRGVRLSRAGGGWKAEPPAP